MSKRDRDRKKIAKERKQKSEAVFQEAKMFHDAVHAMSKQQAKAGKKEA